MTISSYIRPVLIATTLSISGITSSIATADTQQVSVDISDLNLQTNEGAATLVQRIEDASEEACARSTDSDHYPRSLTDVASSHRDFEHCMAEAIEAAVDDISDPIAMSVVDARIDELMAISAAS
ncbi:MAG: UrcA family protein [Pseudomonadota bacterium]